MHMDDLTSKQQIAVFAADVHCSVWPAWDLHAQWHLATAGYTKPQMEQFWHVWSDVPYP